MTEQELFTQVGIRPVAEAAPIKQKRLSGFPSDQ